MLQRLKNNQTRTQKTLKNARVGALCYLLSLFVSFFSRGLFLEHLGTEFLGFTGSVGSILGFLNIAEFGISAAVSMVLYKPLFDQNLSEINALVSILGYLYRWVGIFIGVGGVVVSFFLPWIFPSVGFPVSILYFGYYTLLICSLIGYFVNYHSVLLSADQRNYVVLGYYQFTYTLKVITQWIIVLYSSSLIAFLSIELLWGVCYSIILRYRIHQTYPWLNPTLSRGRTLLNQYPQIRQKVSQSFAHCMGGFVQNQSTPLFVYSFVSLPMVAIYANYMLIVSSLRLFIRNAFGGMIAGIGNLIAEGDLSRVRKLYWELFSFRFFCAGVLSGCMYWLLPGFITSWVGPQYLLSGTVTALIVIHFFLLVLRPVTDDFLFAFGMVQDVWSPFAESLVFIISSCFFGYFWGLTGVILGPILSLVFVIYSWKPYFLFSRGLQLSILYYVRHFFLYLVSLIVSLVFTVVVMFWLNPVITPISNQWLHWLAEASMFTFVLGGTSFMVYWVFFSEFRCLFKRLISSFF